MVRLLALANLDYLFANAGQAVVERALNRALIETGRVKIRLIALGNPAELPRLQSYYKDLISNGSLEVVPNKERTTDQLLEGMDGLMIHGLSGSFDWIYCNQVFNRLPVVVHLHSLQLSALDRMAYLFCLSNWNGRQPLWFVAPTRSTGRRIQALIQMANLSSDRAPRVEIIPHGLVPGTLHRGNPGFGRRLLAFPRRTRVILSLNRISPQKFDYLQLVLAFAELVESRGGERALGLALVGGVAEQDRTYVAAIRELAQKLGLADRVHIREHLQEGHKKHILAAGDVLVSIAANPQESFGISLLEGMAAGVPIVATDWDGYREVLPDAYRPWLVPTIASHDLALAIDWGIDTAALTAACAPSFPVLVDLLDRLLRDRTQAARLGKIGQRHVRNFTWEASAHRFVALWESMATGGPGDRLAQSVTPTFISPVDGLATEYLSERTRLRTTGRDLNRAVLALQEPFRATLTPEMLGAVVAACPSDFTMLAHLRAAVAMEMNVFNRLVLHLLRCGVIESRQGSPAATSLSAGPFGEPQLQTARSNRRGNVMIRTEAVRAVKQLVKYARRQATTHFAPRFPRVEATRVLGIACTGHGASIAYVDAQGTVRSSVLDRWAGVKYTLMFAKDEDKDIRHPVSELDQEIHDIFCYGFGTFPETRLLEDSLAPWTEWLLRDLQVTAGDIDLVVTSESHFGTCAVRLGPELKTWFPGARFVSSIEHHEIHQRQAFWQSGFSQAAVLTLDTCGENLRRLGGRKLAGTLSVMTDKGECRVLKELLFPESSVGMLYDAVSHHVGFPQGEEGKTMGLAAYGEPELFDQIRSSLHLDEEGGFSFLRAEDFTAKLEAYVPARGKGESINQAHMNVAYAGQACVELIVANAFSAALRLGGMQDLAYAGGVALNSVANEKAYRSAKPARLYVAPNPGDTGHALGCALFGAYELAGWTPPRREVAEYLGPPYTPAEIESAARSSGYTLSSPEDLDQVVARCIANGYILARFSGSSEFGPRALGNRSILCDPRRGDMKDYLNARVKHREAFRPFAPTVLEEYAQEWFDVDVRSAYMLRVISVRDEKRDQIPAVVHVDGTARLQTLGRQENPGYWRLINAFRELTGVPLVLNTSLNLAGKPIVETPDDAVACFESTEIDILVMAPFVLSKRPIAEYLTCSR